MNLQNELKQVQIKLYIVKELKELINQNLDKNYIKALNNLDSDEILEEIFFVMFIILREFKVNEKQLKPFRKKYHQYKLLCFEKLDPNKIIRTYNKFKKVYSKHISTNIDNTSC